jgi:hypothetical protein
MITICSQISGHTVGEVLIVSDMHERKAEMARRADAFIALPGIYMFKSHKLQAFLVLMKRRLLTAYCSHWVFLG